MNRSTASPPLLVFGLDAGDADLILRWAGDGTLPHIGSIIRQGSYARTAGPELVSEHGMWTSLTSGVSRADHGYYYFRQLVPGTYDLAPARGRHLNVEPFWQRLAPERRIAIVDVPDIAAPVPQAGFQISEWATHYPYFDPSFYPEALRAQVESEFGPQMVIHEQPKSDVSEDLEIYRRLKERVKKKGKLCRSLLADGQFDLVYIVFGECHTGGHQFWRYLSETGQAAPTDPSGELSAALRTLYRDIDVEIGAILERQPPGANVFIVTSVGLKSQWPAMGLTAALPFQFGLQVAPPLATRLDPLSVLRKMLPQGVRNLLSARLSQEAQERLISDKFSKSTDWARTQVFSIPSYYSSQFRVNLKGREPQGIVQPGADYERALNRLETELNQIIDPVTNRPAIKALYRIGDLFGGGPPGELPDLIAEWQDADHFVERVCHPAGDIVQAPCDFHRGSDHSQFGFVAGAGPDVKSAGDLGDISPLDLAPTFLALLRHESPSALPREPLKELLMYHSL